MTELPQLLLGEFHTKMPLVPLRPRNGQYICR